MQYVVPDPLLLPNPCKKKKRAKTNKQTQNLNRLKKDEKTLSQGEFKRKCSTAIDKGDYSFFLPLWNHKL